MVLDSRRHEAGTRDELRHSTMKMRGYTAAPFSFAAQAPIDPVRPLSSMIQRGCLQTRNGARVVEGVVGAEPEEGVRCGGVIHHNITSSNPSYSI